MKLEEVPQDENSVHAGHKKLVYALNAKQEYTPATSKGWEADSYATRLAVAEFASLAEQAQQEWQQGKVSPLKYLMYQHRLDLVNLAQITGLFKWRIQRHFKPQIFSKLSSKLITTYAQAFKLDIAYLKQLQEQTHDQL